MPRQARLTICDDALCSLPPSFAGLAPPKLCLSLFSDYAEMAAVDDVVDLLNQPKDVVNAFELAKEHGGVSPKDVVEAIHPLERY